MNSQTLAAFLPLIVPAIVGVLTRYCMAGLKKASLWVDTLPAWAKQTIVVVIAMVLTSLAALTGVDLCGGHECTGLAAVTTGGLGALVSAIFAMVTHNGKKLAETTSTP